MQIASRVPGLEMKIKRKLSTTVGENFEIYLSQMTTNKSEDLRGLKSKHEWTNEMQNEILKMYK